MSDIDFKNDYSIFKFLPSNLNDKLSNLSSSDKNNLLHYLSSYYLELRNNLNIKKENRYGLEFEFEDASRKKIEKELYNNGFHDFWDLKDDDTLYDGAEIASPQLTDDWNNWSEINTLCQILRKYSIIGNNSGAHVHIGAEIFEDSKEAILNFILLWCCYENIIYRFLYGEFLNERQSLKSYARSVAKKFYDDYNILLNMNDISNIELIKWFFYCDKTYSINFLNITSFSEPKYKNTVEFRAANGSLDPIIWQNYLNLYIKMVQYCKSKTFNKELVMNRIYKVQNDFSKLKTYRKIYLEQALEFCDLIFDNNQDKIYFLRQYIKDGSVTESSLLTPSKPFTKTLYKSK